MRGYKTEPSQSAASVAAALCLFVLGPPMAVEACSSEVADLNANIKADISRSSGDAATGNWCSCKMAIEDLAEMPFIEVVIPEIFEISNKIYSTPRKKGRHCHRGRRRWRLPKKQQLEHMTGSDQGPPGQCQIGENMAKKEKKSENQSKNDVIEQQHEGKAKSERSEEQLPETEDRLKEESSQEPTHADKASDIEEKLGQEQKRTEAQENLKGPEQKLEQCEGNKAKRKRPNYFVAIPIINDQILDKIEDVQELVVTKEAKLLRALIPVEKVHITILVAHLPTADDVKKAISAMMQCEAKIAGILHGEQLSLIFHGVGQFNGQVIFVKLEVCQERLSMIAESIAKSFAELGIDITGSKDFKPHLTFLKLSKAPSLRRKGFKKVSAALYEGYEDAVFGTEILTRIDLCSMQKKPQESGYFFCEYSIHIGTAALAMTPELEASCAGALSTSMEQEGSANTKMTSDAEEAGSSTSRITTERETSNLATKMECSTLGVPAQHEPENCLSAVVTVPQQPLSQYPEDEEAVPCKQKVGDFSISNVTQELETRRKICKEDIVEMTSGSMDTKETLKVGSPRRIESTSELQMGCSDTATFPVAQDLEGSAIVPQALEVVIENSKSVAVTLEKEMICSNNSTESHISEIGNCSNTQVTLENEFPSVMEELPLHGFTTLEKTQNLESGESTTAAIAFAMTQDLGTRAPCDDTVTINLHTDCSTVAGTTTDIVRTGSRELVPTECEIAESRIATQDKVPDIECPHNMDAIPDLDRDTLTIAEVTLGVEIGVLSAVTRVGGSVVAIVTQEEGLLTSSIVTQFEDVELK